jgi:alcohol dehydrogenase class IV
MDALTHAIEAYTCIPANPMTDAYALKAIECISRNLLPAYANGDNLEAREQMLMGSLLAGIAFTNSALGAVHAFSETVGGLYDIPHGIANAIFLPPVMEYNLVARPDRFAHIAAAMGQPVDGLDSMQAAYKSVEAVKQIAHHCEIPGMAAVGVKKEDFEPICQRILDDIGPPCNPRKLTKEGLLGILAKMEREG